MNLMPLIVGEHGSNLFHGLKIYWKNAKSILIQFFIQQDNTSSLVPARLFRFLLLVYTHGILRYNRINMSNKKDEGCVTIFKLKLRKLIEAIERGAKVEDVKAELERMIE